MPSDTQHHELGLHRPNQTGRSQFQVPLSGASQVGISQQNTPFIKEQHLSEAYANGQLELPINQPLAVAQASLGAQQYERHKHFEEASIPGLAEMLGNDG